MLPSLCRLMASIPSVSVYRSLAGADGSLREPLPGPAAILSWLPAASWQHRYPVCGTLIF